MFYGAFAFLVSTSEEAAEVKYHSRLGLVPYFIFSFLLFVALVSLVALNYYLTFHSLFNLKFVD